MLPLILTAYLFTPTVRPVRVEENLHLASLKQKLTQPADLIRGRILASFVKKGMREKAVCGILGEPGLSFGTLHTSMETYDRLGVTVVYRLKYFEVAGDEHPHSDWIVTDVIVHPISHCYSWLCPVGPSTP
jgi:hypothetical protein